MQRKVQHLLLKSDHLTGQERRRKNSSTIGENMKLAMLLPYSNRFSEAVDRVVQLEKAGLDLIYVPEAYAADAVSAMGYLAAKTDTVQIGSGILPIYSRTPTLLAMTAVGMDEISNGRFVLGLGASGPQVIEGFHGIPYKAPLGHTREAIEICRKVWKREEKLTHDGKYYTLPLPEDQGTGLGKPLKIITHPLRPNIPIHIASLGPKNVELTAELAEGWLPTLFMPDKADLAFGDALTIGLSKRSSDLPPLDIVAGGMVAIGDDVKQYLDFGRPNTALYVGGMGARGKNFYNSLVQRYGFEQEALQIQDLYLSGKKKEAEAAVPLELLEGMNLVGPEGYIKEKIAQFAEAGVTYLNIGPIGPPEEQMKIVEKLKEIIS
jgi:F420-dependent oxidoreductase-like protein